MSAEHGARTWRVLRGHAVLALLVAGPLSAQPAARGDVRPQFDGIRGGAEVSPNVAKLGERVTYRGSVRSQSPVKVRVLTPTDPGAFHWGPPVLRSGSPYRSRSDSVGSGAWLGPGMEFVIEAPLQVFSLGAVTVPGLQIEVDDGRGPRRLHLPTAHIVIAPVVSATDTAADLRALRGPIAAPWWERVPWRWVLLALLLIGAVITVIVLRRRRVAVPAPAPVMASRPRDPVADALRELEALRRMGLPAKGLFDEHALQLTRIARRFLEAVAGHTRPGDTTPEVVQGLATSRLDHEEVRQVEGLLRMWDRLKFARAQSSTEESARAEASVESLIRRHARASDGPVAKPAAGEAA